MPFYGIGENNVLMDGYLEIELCISDMVVNEDPPLKTKANVSPPPGGNETVPTIVDPNVNVV